MPTITGRTRLPDQSTPTKGTWHAQALDERGGLPDGADVLLGIKKASDTGNGASMLLKAGWYRVWFRSSALFDGKNLVLGPWPVQLTSTDTTWGAILGAQPVGAPLTPSQYDQLLEMIEDSGGSVPEATTTEPGKVRRATAQEVTNGAGVNAYVVPDRLKVELDLSRIFVDPHAVEFGAKGDGTTNDQAALQAAIDFAAANGGGLVMLRKGASYAVDGLKLRTNTAVKGQGLSTNVFHRGGATEPCISLFDAAQVNTGIHDLQIRGRRTEQTNPVDGINLNHTGGVVGILPRHRVTNVTVRDVKGNGVVLGDYTRTSILDGISVYFADGFGLVMGGADSIVTNVDVGQSGKDGIVVVGDAYHASNLKAWFSGRIDGVGAGFLISGSRNTINGAFSQENKGHGFSFFKSGQVVTGVVLTGAVSDADNTSDTAKMGFNLFNTANCIIQGVVAKFAAGAGTPFQGISIQEGTAGTSVGNTIELSVTGTSSWAVSPASVTAGSTLRINGRDRRVLAQPFSATIGVNPWTAETFTLALTGSVTMSNPSVKNAGLRMRWIFTQDATGGRAVTWGSDFKVTGTLDTAAGAVTAFEFVSNGTSWIQVGGTTAASAGSGIGAGAVALSESLYSTDFTAAAGETSTVDTSTASRTVVDGVTTSGSKVVTSATAAFASTDVGRPIFGLGIPAGATIASVESATSLTTSVNSTTSLTAVNLTIGSGQVTATLPASAPVNTRVRIDKADASPLPLLVVPGAGDTIEGPTTLRARHVSRTYHKVTATGWRCLEGLTPIAASGSSAGGATTRQSGCVLSITGDSIAPARTTPPHVIGSAGGQASSWGAWLQLLSGGKVQIGVVDGIGSTRGDQITARFPRMLEACPAHFVVCDASYTNSASAGVAVATFLTQLKAQADMAAATGATPVVHTGYPVAAAAQGLTDGYRRGVMSLAARHGWVLVDTWSALVDPANGNYLAAYDSGDNTHPNNLGKKVIALTFLDALTPRLTPFTPLPQMLNTAAQSGSLLANGLFLTDTNADGVPDGWTKGGGSVAVSLVSGDTTIRGNALRLSDTASGGYTQVTTGTLAGTATGRTSRRVAFSGRLKVDGTTGVTLSCLLKSPTTGKTVALIPINAWGSVTDGWLTFHMEGVTPPDCNGIEVNFNSNGGTALDARLAQLRVDDVGAAA